MFLAFQVRAAHGARIDFHQQFAPQVEQLAEMAIDGLLQIEGDRISITARGRPFLRNICMPFDAYLDSNAGNGVRFSATV